MEVLQTDLSSRLNDYIIPQLEELLHQLNGDVLSSDQKLRRRALHFAQRICTKLESPMDTIIRLSWQEPAFNCALNTALDSKAFDVLGNHKPQFVTIEELARDTGADANLLHRMLRHLGAMGAVPEQAPGSYAATPLTEGLRKVEVSGGLDYWFDIAAPLISNLRTFLMKKGFKDPEDMDNGNFQEVRQTQLNAFEWIMDHPRQLTSHGNFMSGYTSERGSWLDVYPVERILEGADPEAVLFVDVGGGLGHDTEKLRKRNPNARAKLVVQDLPFVVKQGQGKVDSAIQMMAHDFFTPQPIQGARAYFLHSVLHDLSDKKAIEILDNLKPSLKRGYSKLLINESVMPSTGANPLSTALDILVMAAFSTRERSRVEWEKLLDAAGFRIVAIWADPAVAYESVIEAEFA